MLTVEWEPLDRLLDDGVEDLLALHWIESEIDRDAIPLDPDWQWAGRLAKAGILWPAGLRSDGELVGYAAFVVQPHIHFRTSLYAVNDCVFVHPERRGRGGLKLIRDCEAMLAGQGVRKIMYGVKSHVRVGAGGKGSPGDILARLGYTHAEDVYSKLIG